MSTVSLQHGELRDVLARARVVARFYVGKQVTSTAAVAVVLDRLDQVELQLANARIALNNGRPRRAA
ncbi:MAG TPA: hypothetical protein VGJ58_02285 [Gaiellaceae bacterium]|jgi:hypothetical protein